ncbi:hypothetical protein SAMN05660816_01250 [Niastella yeongjuensis]|nr:hypothetical protein SAMN05660816_01250 [Niastella yeongjuensis]
MLALVAISSFSACSKTTTKTYYKEDLIGTYTIVSITSKISGSSELNVTDDYLQDCQKDDLMVLKSDLSLQMVDAGTTCYPSSNDSGDWDVNGSTFYWNGEPYKIRSLTTTNLVIEEVNSNSNNDEVITVTLVKR